MRAIIFVALTAGACTSEPPSCDSAMAHYYESGCVSYDARGEARGEADAIANCKAMVLPKSCDALIETYLTCLDSVASNACSSCDDERAAMFACP